MDEQRDGGKPATDEDQQTASPPGAGAGTGSEPPEADWLGDEGGPAGSSAPQHRDEDVESQRAAIRDQR
ncbi:MAG: hypothetical protein AB7I24_15450 [Candidatus Nanopelagicales bacterium]|jgi:hypothetical protein